MSHGYPALSADGRDEAGLGQPAPLLTLSEPHQLKASAQRVSAVGPPAGEQEKCCHRLREAHRYPTGLAIAEQLEETPGRDLSGLQDDLRDVPFIGREELDSGGNVLD